MHMTHSMEQAYLCVSIHPCPSSDQPLYALAKQIQWSWPTTLGEEHYIVIFGGLHIGGSQDPWRSPGRQWMDSSTCSCWCCYQWNSRFFSEGMSCDSHAKDTLNYQITATSLYLLMKKAYNDSIEVSADENQVTYFEMWCIDRANLYPQFQFWSMTM